MSRRTSSPPRPPRKESSLHLRPPPHPPALSSTILAERARMVPSTYQYFRLTLDSVSLYAGIGLRKRLSWTPLWRPVCDVTLSVLERLYKQNQKCNRPKISSLVAAHRIGSFNLGERQALTIYETSFKTEYEDRAVVTNITKRIDLRAATAQPEVHNSMRIASLTIFLRSCVKPKVSPLATVKVRMAIRIDTVGQHTHPKRISSSNPKFA